MGQDLVALAGPARNHHIGRELLDRQGQSLTPGFWTERVEDVVFSDMYGGGSVYPERLGRPVCVHGIPNQEHMNVAVELSGRGECLQRCFHNSGTLGFGQYQDVGHYMSPNSSNRSAIAGAASGPSPNFTVLDSVAGGCLSRTRDWPPASADASNTFTPIFFDARRPFMVG